MITDIHNLPSPQLTYWMESSLPYKLVLINNRYVLENRHRQIDAVALNNGFRQALVGQRLHIVEYRGEIEKVESVNLSISTISKTKTPPSFAIDKLPEAIVGRTHYLTINRDGCIYNIELTSEVECGRIGPWTRIVRGKRTMSIETIVTELRNKGIRGLDDQLRLIGKRLLFSRMCNDEQFRRLNISKVKGMILHGPPGTGKTLIASHMAKVLGDDVVVKVVRGPELLNKYVGGSEENVRALFQDAEDAWKRLGSKAPIHVIIIDEADSILGDRSRSLDTSGVGRNVVNQILSIFGGQSRFDNIIVIGTTNNLHSIDKAILRPGRMGLHIKIDLPDREGRRDIFEYYLSSRGIAHLNLDTLAELSEGLSGSDIESAVSRAVEELALSCLDAGIDIDVQHLTTEDVLQMIVS